MKWKQGGKSKSSSPHSGSHPKVQPSPISDGKKGLESSGKDMPPPLQPCRDKKDDDSSGRESELGLKNHKPE